MEKIKDYNLSFGGLKLGENEFVFKITQPFFDLFEFNQDFRSPELEIRMLLDKKNNFLDLKPELHGSVELDCDLTNEAYRQEISGTTEILVKFGEEFDDSDDEVWILPQGENKVNVAQLFYEMTLLALPAKRIHPDVLHGKSHSDMLELLEKYSPEAEENLNDEEVADPRWEQLKKLKES
ncbi:MAG: DUF177 domain-containing protein [Weeksellaceae bacterium]